MRLIDIKRSINVAYENFEPKYSNANGNYYIDNVLGLKVSIQELYDIGIIKRIEFGMDIYSVIESSMTDRLTLDSSQINGYRKFLDGLKIAIDMFHSWINNYVPTEETETVIAIKLPNISNLEDLAKASILLKKSFSQIVPEIGGEIKVTQLDHGSYWVIIDVGINSAVYLVGALAISALKIAKMYADFKLTYEKYRNYKLQNDALKEVKETNDNILKSEIRIAAESICKEHFEEYDNERCERISLSIRELSELLRSGGEIHPSLIAPKDIKDQFPNYQKLSISQNITAELPRNNDVGTNESPKDKESNQE